MPNELDEITGPVETEGRDSHVIAKQIQIKVGPGSHVFEIAVFIVGFVPAILKTIAGNPDNSNIVIWWLAGFAPGLIWLYLKVQARNYFQKLQQQIQAYNSQIDAYLEQRVVILQNVAQLVNKAVDLDKEVMVSVAAMRGGISGDEGRNKLAADIDHACNRLFPQVEAYPELKAHAAIADAMKQNSYLQREITAARTLLNDTVAIWNADVFSWPVKMIVAAKAGYTTRLPFSVSAEVKQQARGTFF